MEMTLTYYDENGVIQTDGFVFDVTFHDGLADVYGETKIKYTLPVDRLISICYL